MEIEIKKSIKIHDSDIEDIFDNAINGDNNHWIDYAEPVGALKGRNLSEHISWHDGAITLYGYNPTEEWTITKNEIWNGIQKYVSEFGYQNLIDEYYNFDTYNIGVEANYIIQLGLFDEIIYDWDLKFGIDNRNLK